MLFVLRRIPKTIQFIPDLRNVEHELLPQFRQRYENTCTKECGYILEVVRIVEVLRRKLSAYNGNVIVDCIIEVKCLLPEPGQRVQGTIKQAYAQGLIVAVEDCMKVFIPRTSVPGNVTFQVQDPIEFEITQTRFQKGRYDCIGKCV